MASKMHGLATLFKISHGTVGIRRCHLSTDRCANNSDVKTFITQQQIGQI